MALQSTRNTPQPGDYGQRARSTIPFAVERVEPSESTEVMTREPCWQCLGAGTLDGKVTICDVCRREHTYEQVKAHGRRMIRNILLPCGHGTRTRDVVWVAALCPTCKDSPVGRGYLMRWRPLGPFLEWMREWFEQRYAEISGEITAHPRALPTQRALRLAFDERRYDE